MQINRARWRDFFAMNAWFLGLGFMWNSLHRFILPATLPLFVGISLQATALSALTTVGLIIAIIVQPIAGALSDHSLSRFGRRRPMMTQWTLVSAALLGALAFAPNYAILFALYALLQVASNMAHGPAQGLIPDLVPQARRGAAGGVKSLLDNFSLVLAGLVTGNFLLQLSPDLLIAARGALLTLVAALVLFLCVTIITTRETPLSRAALPQESLRASVLSSLSIVGNVRQVWRDNRPFAWLLGVRLLFLAGVQIVANYAQFYFKDIILAGEANAAQRAPQLTGQLLVVVAMMLVVVSLPAGLLSDRFGRRAVSAVGSVLAMSGAAALLLIRNAPLVQFGNLVVSDLMAAGTLLGMGAGIFYAVNWAWATDLVSSDQAARYLGISNLATAGAGILAALGGPLIDWGNAQTMGFGYTLVFMTSAVWLLVTLALLPRVPETRRQRV